MGLGHLGKKETEKCENPEPILGYQSILRLD